MPRVPYRFNQNTSMFDRESTSMFDGESLRRLARAALVCAAVLCSPTACSVEDTKQHAADFAHQASDLQPDPAVKWGRLPNGIRYALVRNAQPKGRASLRFGVMAGSLDETDAQRGLAHFLEHLAFNGSKHFASGSLIEKFQRLGMSFGGDTNAFTAPDRTVYMLELPETTANNFDFAFTLFSDFAGGLTLSPESIEKERGIILSELRDSDTHRSRTATAQAEFVVPKARSTYRDPIGLAQVISTAQREQFVDFYNTWYRPENYVVVVAGDIDLPKVEAQLVKALGPVVARGSSRPRAEQGTIPINAAPQARFHLQPDAAATSISIDLVQPYTAPADSADRRKRAVPLQLAVAMMNRRFDALAEKEAEVITAGRARTGESFDFMRSAGVDVICGEHARWRQCLATADQQLRTALEHGFAPEELADAVAGLRQQLKQSVSDASTRSSGEIADGVIFSVMDEEVFTSSEDDFALLDPVLAKMTAEECARALRELWSSQGSLYLFISGAEKIPDQEILVAYEASRAEPVELQEKRTTPRFAYDASLQPGEVASRKHIDDLGITSIVFKNGVRLNLKPTQFDAGRLIINMRLGGGLLSVPRGQEELAMLVSTSFVAGALGKHSDDDLRSILAGRAVGIQFNVGADAFEASAGSTPEDLLLQLQLLRAFMTDPGYRPEALRQYRKGIEQNYARAPHVLTVPQHQEIPRLLANGDARFGLPKDAKPLLDRNFDEVRAWLTPVFEHGALEIAIVGDFAVEQAIAQVAQTFGNLPPRAAKLLYAVERRVSYPSAPITKEYRIDTDIQQALVSVHWPATDRSDIRLVRRMDVLSSILGDRLRVRLREQMNQTYSPRVRDELSDTFRGFGYIVANASVAPEHAAGVAAAIKEVAADMATNGISEDELNRSKGPELAHMRDAIRDNGYWMGTLAAIQEFPERADWFRTHERDFKSISVADINALAARYLDPKRASVFTILPGEPK